MYLFAKNRCIFSSKKWFFGSDKYDGSHPMQWSRVSNSMFWGLPSPPTSGQIANGEISMSTIYMILDKSKSTNVQVAKSTTRQCAKYCGKDGDLQQIRIYRDISEHFKIPSEYIFIFMSLKKVEETFSHSCIRWLHICVSVFKSTLSICWSRSVICRLSFHYSAYCEDFQPL